MTARLKTRGLVLIGAAVLVAVAGAAGCSSDDGAKSVDVTLSEWIVQPDPPSVDSGEIEITGDNQGAETHELVVVKAANADALPTDDDGAVVEDELPEGALIGEVEDVGTGAKKSVKLDLEPGRYVFFCNITEEAADGTVESHFAKGMHANVEVK